MPKCLLDVPQTVYLELRRRADEKREPGKRSSVRHLIVEILESAIRQESAK